MHQQPDFDRPDVTGSSADASDSSAEAEKETIRAEVSQTCNDLASKIKALEEKVLAPVHKVQDAVQNVQSAVQSSVDAVQGAVHTAKERADSVRNQVSEHPWIAIGAGMVAGMIAGYVSAEPSRPTGASRHRSSSGGGFRAAGNGASSGNGNGASYGAPAEAEDKPGMMSGVKGWFAEEFGKFKGIATGAAIALARDFLKDQAPQFSQNIDQFMNDMTHKLGATPFKERLFDSDKGLSGLGSLFGSSARQQRPTGV